jgi:uncharacterized protein with NRDE domain
LELSFAHASIHAFFILTSRAARLAIMCVIAIGWRVFATAPVVMWSNRDEFLARPSAPLAAWPDHPGIVAGRDLQEGGTWFSVHNNGRFAAITNFRDPSERVEQARSRGELPVQFLLSALDPLAFIASIQSAAARYRGFSLLVGDHQSAAVFESRSGQVTPLKPGVLAFSNGPIAAPWPKCQRLAGAMAGVSTLAAVSDIAKAGFAALANATPAPTARLPHTGVSQPIEAALSSVFIPASPAFAKPYQTRASTVAAWTGQAWSVTERRFPETAAGKNETTVLTAF